MFLAGEAERIDHVFAGGNQRGDESGQKPDERRHPHDNRGGLPLDAGETKGRAAGLHSFGKKPAQSQTGQSSQQTNCNRFAENKLKNFRRRISKRAENGHLSRALADGHGDSVSGHQENRERNSTADGGEEKLDVAQECEE